MADTVTTIKLIGGEKYAVFKFTNESDGTGESAVTKIDISTLLRSNGSAPENVAIDEITYDVNGFNYVVMEWSRTAANYPLAVMKGTGYKEFESVSYLQDPGKGAAGTGDIILTTDGGADGSSYDITIKVKLRD